MQSKLPFPPKLTLATNIPFVRLPRIIFHFPRFLPFSVNLCLVVLSRVVIFAAFHP